MNRFSLTSYTQLDNPSQLCQLDQKIIAYKNIPPDQTIDQVTRKHFAIIHANGKSSKNESINPQDLYRSYDDLDPAYVMEDLTEIKVESSVLEKHDHTFRCDLRMNICTSKRLKQIYIRKLSIEELKEIHENSYFSTPLEAPCPPTKEQRWSCSGACTNLQ